MPVDLAALLGRLAAGLAFVLALPLMMLAALAVLVALGSPILFAQTRSGRGKVPFTIHKFRTMTDARDASGRPLPDAARTTPATRFLRRTRIDELPQLLAIARGELAWIGPRPLMPPTIEGFADLGDRRASVRPGLTGWAQVNGNTLLADQAKLALDLWYISHRTIWLDGTILWLTAVTLLRGEKRSAHRIDEATRFLATAS